MAKNVAPGTPEASLAALWSKGVRYATAIDLGSADGYFFLNGHTLGLFPDVLPFNVDANATYEDSLRAIQDTFGGHYFIGAVTDHDGEVEMTNAVHPYWDSLRPDDDPYWNQVDKLGVEKTVVPAARPDSLAARFGLTPPFVIKLDVQGAEIPALRGARRVLRDMVAVICEADISDFHGIDAALCDEGFGLLDVANINRAADGALGWFYPVYLNHAYDRFRTRMAWDEAQNDNVILVQVKRREATLAEARVVLARARARRGLPPG